MRAASALRWRRRRRPGRRTGPWGPAVPALLAAAGLLFATTAGTARGTDLRPDDRADLADLIRSEQVRLERDNRRVEALRREIDATTSRATGEDGPGGSAPGRATELAAVVGLAPMRGPGVTVSLDDAPRSARENPPPGTGPDDFVVHQQDLQAVVNALWVGGAEAMQLMDQRVIATSAVRCVGNTLILQGRVYSPPYVVTAIGPVEAMLRALEEAPGVAVFRHYVDTVGVRYAVRREETVTVAGYRGSLDLRHASPATPVIASPTPP